jgi:hypothetical protein
MNAAEDAKKPNRWALLFVGAVIVVWVAWIFATSHFGDEYLPSQTFAGCYVSANGDPVELDPSGALQSRGSTLGAFKVLAPVGGKHGPLIQVDEISVLRKGQNVYFGRGREGWFWPVTGDELQVTVYPPGTLVTFRKTAASHCR